MTTRERYEAICEASPDAIVLVDGAGTITYANRRVSDLFGYDPQALVGEPVELLLPESDREDHVALRDAYLADPETRPMGADLDLRARREDGSTVPVDVSLSPLNTTGGAEVMAAVRDVTDRRDLREKYRSILEAVPDPVIIADADTGEVLEANAEVQTLLGRDPDDVVGASQASIHPSDETERYRDLFETHVSDGQAIYAEFPDGSPIYVERADGTRVPVEINARVFELGDRTTVVGVFRDVSSLRERERQLRRLTAATRRLMAAGDREAVAREVTRAADSILGYEQTVVRLVENDRQLRPVAVTEGAESEMGERPVYSLDGDTPAARAFRQDEPLRIEDLRAEEDGFDRGPARAAMYLPIDDHGVVSVVDATAGAFDGGDVELAAILAANAEAALDRLGRERELQRQNDRLEEFASVVSHDLRNPLHVANGWLGVARDERDTDALDRIADALDRMSEIIEDTLTLAREGQRVAERRPVDVERLATECWSMTSTSGGQLEVQSSFLIEADPERLQHVFENLFRNSVEHGSTDDRTESGDAVQHGSTSSRAGPDDAEHDAMADATGDDVDPGVTVTVGRIDEEGFYVEDDGPGVPEEERSEVFQAGYTTGAGGTGFGLTIVREIAEAHGWRVRVTESETGGARFEFTGVEFG